MGHGSWSDDNWKSYAKNSDYSSKSTKQIFKENKLNQYLDPKGVKIRESRDSKDNPESTAIIVALDETGSMHRVLDVMARKGLNTLATSIHEKKPVKDPHIMVMGIGDINYDQAPLQVSQFEADLRIAEQLEKIYLEGGGGGNNSESYTLPWFFAAFHTSIDCFEKRGKKGYLFTIGDEEVNPNLDVSHLQKVLGYRPQHMLSNKELLKKVSEKFEVFHLIVTEGDFYMRSPKSVEDSWKELLGQRAILLHDHTKMAEVIVSTIQVHEGGNHEDVSKAWQDPATAAIINKALSGYNRKLDLDF